MDPEQSLSNSEQSSTALSHTGHYSIAPSHPPPQARCIRQAFIPGMYQVSTRYPQGIHKGSTRDLQGICKVFARYPQGIHRGSTRDLQGIHKVSTRYPPGIHKVSTRFPRGIHRGSTRYPQGIPQGSTGDLQGIYKGSTRDIQGIYKGSTKDPQGTHKGSTRDLVTFWSIPHQQTHSGKAFCVMVNKNRIRDCLESRLLGSQHSGRKEG